MGKMIFANRMLGEHRHNWVNWCRNMKINNSIIIGLFAVIACVIVALHSPGEMSVDSIMALYEGATHNAVGWGPTFMASTIDWLGGGVLGTSFLVALTCLLTYGCFTLLIVSRSTKVIPTWQVIVAVALALNPIFMFYVGIIWKDVMLATVSLVAATCLFLAIGRHGAIRYALVMAAVVISGMTIPIRQQGILIALPLACVAGGLVVTELRCRKLVSVAVVVMSIVIMLGCSTVFYALSANTVRPQASGPVSVGIRTIQAYDIAGMIAKADPGDPSKWSGAPPKVRSAIKAHYSSQRIDTIWHLAPVRDYFNGLTADQFASVWIHGIKHSPWVYIKTRFDAFSELLGLHKIAGCVPAYWGTSGLPKQVKALGLKNQMDARALMVGHTAQSLYRTPVFRNWFYAIILLCGTMIAVFRIGGQAKLASLGVAIAGWLYFASFIPTTIACDVRYLYPVALLGTILCIFVLGETNVFAGIWVARRRYSGHSATSGRLE